MDYDQTLMDRVIEHYQIVIDIFVIIGWILVFCVVYTFIAVILLATIRLIIEWYHRRFTKTRRRYK